MNNRKHWILISVFFIGVMFFPADFLEISRANESDTILLEGLKAVRVQVVQPVSGFEDKPKFNPVNVNHLQANIEETLYKACIEAGEGSFNDTEIGQIVVTVNVWKDLIFAKYIVQVKTELYQLAELSRDTRLRIMVPTWPVGQELSDIETPMLVTSSELDGKVQEAVRRQMEMFIEDFLEANPDFEPKTDTSNLMSGTIRYVRIEGGFYAIYGDNGEQYNPINLPRAFKKDGLRVAFQAIKSKRTPGILYPGLRIEITRIRKISN